jgi:hypothetical protein
MNRLTRLIRFLLRLFRPGTQYLPPPKPDPRDWQGEDFRSMNSHRSRR